MTKKSWIQGLIITTTCCLVGAAAAIHLYPRITMSNDEAKARQDMQQILAAVREYRAQNNGKYPRMDDLPAELPRFTPVGFWSQESQRQTASAGPRYRLVMNYRVLERLQRYNGKVKFDPEKHPILFAGSRGVESRIVTREGISAPGAYQQRTVTQFRVLAGYLDGRIEYVWTPDLYMDTIATVNTWDEAGALK